MTLTVPVPLVGDELDVPCVDGVAPALPQPRRAPPPRTRCPRSPQRVHDFLPWYSSVHRGAGYKSSVATDAYEERSRRHARASPGAAPAATTSRSSAATPPRPSTTSPTGSGSQPGRRRRHHRRRAPRQPAAVGARWPAAASSSASADGTFTVDDVAAALDARHARSCLAITGASNVTGWMPPIDDIADGRPRARRPRASSTPPSSHPTDVCPPSVDFVAWSGHKMYAPFGAGALVGPRRAFADGDPFLAGGGAVDLVDLDEVVWTDPPEREEAGSPNVLGAVALHAAIDEARPHRLAAHRTPRRAPRPPAALRARRHRRRHRARPRPRHADPAHRHLHRRGRAPRPRRRPVERRVRHRRPPRLLLRPPLPHAAPAPLRRTRSTPTATP